MTSADFSSSKELETSPGKDIFPRRVGFPRFLRHLLARVYWLRASQRCACLPTLTSLGMPFLFVSTGWGRLVFAVLLPSDGVAQTSGHPKRPCSLLIGFANSPMRDRATAAFTLWNKMVSLIPYAHAGHTQNVSDYARYRSHSAYMVVGNKLKNDSLYV